MLLRPAREVWAISTTKRGIAVGGCYPLRALTAASKSFALFLLCLGGCSVGEVDISDKPPPCAPPLVESCDGLRCVEPGEMCPDAGMPPPELCPGAFGVEALELQWSTANALAFAWQVTGDVAEFGRYELWLANSEEGLDGDDAIRLSPETHPELGHYALPRAMGEEVVDQTVALGLDANASYYVRLRAFDRQGEKCELNLGSVRTSLEPINAVSIYEDDRPRGWRLPDGACWAASMEPPHAGGDAHFEHVVHCGEADGSGCPEPGSASCWSNFRFGGLGVDLSGLGVGDFSNAFLEFDMDIEGTSAEVFYSEINLAVGTMTGMSNHRFFRLSVPENGGYRRIQLPLREFQNLTLERLMEGALEQVMWGSTFPDGTVVRIDNVRVRWL